MNNEEKIKEIEENYDDFLKYYYNSPCNGCPEGHPSFWKTVIESKEWKLWEEEQSKNPTRDMAECEELGIMSAGHWKEFMKFIRQQTLEEAMKCVPIQKIHQLSDDVGSPHETEHDMGWNEHQIQTISNLQALKDK